MCNCKKLNFPTFLRAIFLGTLNGWKRQTGCMPEQKHGVLRLGKSCEASCKSGTPVSKKTVAKLSKKCCKKTLSFVGKLILFAGILVAFYKLPELLADKWFYYTVNHRDYRQKLED